MALPFPIQRTFVIASHPDDDVIAAGGLIQRVVAARGDLRIVFVTDGENNPWPQRFTERRFFLTKDDRAVWGAMRRREALCSLARLGVGESAASFLAFPDQGLSKIAREGDSRLRETLRTAIADFHPTLVISPSLFDLHADHRAVANAVHTAAAGVPIITYAVHGNVPTERLSCQIDLSEFERDRKREAIACHRSQLALSRDRFLSYAQPTETFYRAEFDVARVDSAMREWTTDVRHALRVVFGNYPPAPLSGVQATADVEHGAESSLRA
jgi:LmbE family N-acetylglucosaminyl deacetylase